jgi:hypothetical protein
VAVATVVIATSATAAPAATTVASASVEPTVTSLSGSVNVASTPTTRTLSAVTVTRTVARMAISPFRFGTERHSKWFARSHMARKYGWKSTAQFSCLVKLWEKESGWNHMARNRSSGAHGIPQALPGSKMSSAGPNWRTNPETQIKWGLGYIKARYSTPCGAWNAFLRKGWY